MKCYVDDDLDGDLLLRLAASQGHEIVSPRSVGLRGARDSAHLAFAVRNGLPILTGNAGDFERSTIWLQRCVASTSAFYSFTVRPVPADR